MYKDQAYLESEILAADGVKLVRMLYRGAIAAVIAAREELRRGRIAERSLQITKAGEILNELACSVDRERGGEIARNLVELYAYLQSLLQRANSTQTEPPLQEAQSLMETLLQAWEACSSSSSHQATLPNPGFHHAPEAPALQMSVAW